MPSKCCVPACSAARGNSVSGKLKFSMFRFPNDDELKQKWTRAIAIPNFIPTNSTVVCEKHFLPADFGRISKISRDPKTGKSIWARLKQPRLKKDAVPSVFPVLIDVEPMKNNNYEEKINQCVAEDDRILDSSVHHEAKKRKQEEEALDKLDGNPLTKCFVCDEKSRHKKSSLIDGASRSAFGFPHQISQVVGEEFVVVVRKDDYLCKRCVALLDTMDELEKDLETVKEILLLYLKRKYVLLDRQKKNTDVVQKKTESPTKKVERERLANTEEESVDVVKKFIEAQGGYKISLHCSLCPFETVIEDDYDAHMIDHMKIELASEDEDGESSISDNNFESNRKNNVANKKSSPPTVELSSPVSDNNSKSSPKNNVANKKSSNPTVELLSPVIDNNFKSSPKNNVANKKSSTPTVELLSPVIDNNFKSNRKNNVGNEKSSSPTVELRPKKETEKKPVSPVRTISSARLKQQNIKNGKVVAPTSSPLSKVSSTGSGRVIKVPVRSADVKSSKKDIAKMILSRTVNMKNKNRHATKNSSTTEKAVKSSLPDAKRNPAEIRKSSRTVIKRKFPD